MNFLIADIGGTNTRCAIFQKGRNGFRHARNFLNRDFASLTALLSDYLGTVPPADRPKYGRLAIAAPVTGDKIQMTNIDWKVSVGSLKNTLALEDLRVLNDFEALAHALPLLKAPELKLVGAAQMHDGRPKGLIGPGTGLGVAGLVPDTMGWATISGQGGHVTLPACDETEERLIAFARARFGHCSAERLVSGPGLSVIHEFLHDDAGIDAGEIADRADNDDAAAAQTLEVFFRLLGTVAGDLALTLGAFGGVYIGGGIVPRHLKRFVASGFRERFVAKGRYEDYLDRIGTAVIIARNPTFTGLAASIDQSLSSAARGE